MRKLRFRGLLAFGSLAASGGIAFAQVPGYQQANGLSTSSFPIASPYQTAASPYQPAATPYYLTANSVGTGVPHTLIAQEQTTNLPPTGSGHTHIQPGEYATPSAQSSPVQSSPSPASAVMVQPSYAQPTSGYVISGDAGCSSCGTGSAAAPAPTYVQPQYYSSPAVQSYPQPVPDPAVQSYQPVPAYVSTTPSYNSFGCVPSYGLPAPAPAAVAVNPWIFGANALLFDRADREFVRFAHDSNMPSTDYLSTDHVKFDHAGGYELFGGRYFGNGKHALVGSFWELDPEQQTSVFNTAPGMNVRTNIPFTTVGVNSPTTMYGIELPTSNMYDRFDGTYSQRLRRTEDYRNIELNWFSFALGGAARAGVAGCGTGGGLLSRHAARGGYAAGGDCGGCGDCASCQTSCGSCSGPTGACAPMYGARCSPLRIAYLAGFRYFQYDDNLEYAASMTDDMYGVTADDVYYTNYVRNKMYGFQLGGQASYCTGKRISLNAGTKFGVFANTVTHDSYAGVSDRVATVVSGNSYYGQPYSFSNRTTDAALLGEGNLGVGVLLGRGFTANVGYRVIGVTGVATAPGQVPRDFGLLNDAQRINRSGSLILHGLTVGGAYNW